MIKSLRLIVSGNLFHREMACGKNECLYTSVLAYGTKIFFPCTLYMSCVVFSCSGVSYKQVVGCHVVFICCVVFSCSGISCKQVVSWLLYLVEL